MNIIILEAGADSFFSQAQILENKHPEGKWRYCKFADKKTVLGILEIESKGPNSFKVHPEFFKYFLGLFKPRSNADFDVHQEESFTNLCIKLNDLLKQEKDIYDLSVNKMWIWSEGDSLKMPNKLLDFLDFH